MSNLIHYQPTEKSYNVRCLNGDAHASRTNKLSSVTCPLCLNHKTNEGFWDALWKRFYLRKTL